VGNSALEIENLQNEANKSFVISDSLGTVLSFNALVNSAQ